MTDAGSLLRHDIPTLGAMLRRGDMTATDLLDATKEVIRLRDPHLHAVVTDTFALAEEQAARADREIADGIDRGPLHGIPYGLKDVFDVGGVRTTCHSALLLDNIAAENSGVAERLSEAGAVVVAKLGSDEFAFGGPTEDLPFPFPLNPWNVACTTGGSSTGSAAAVAGGMLRFAMGTDTGGSIRGPAALCGLVGLKPTFGRVSRRGSFPLAHSLDHCGPLAATVREAALVLQAIAGQDPRDPASSPEPVRDYVADLENGVKGLRIGIPRAFFEKAQGVSRDALENIARAEDLLRDAGAIVETIDLPDYNLFSTAGRVILTAEAYAIHEADMQARPEKYSSLAMQRIMLGAAIPAVDYIQAQRQRRLLAAAVNESFRKIDLILTVSSLAAAPRLDSMPDPFTAPSVIQAYPFSMSGHPAVSVPTTINAAGLPLSAQLVAPYFDESRLLRAARALESGFGWRLPALTTEASVPDGHASHEITQF